MHQPEIVSLLKEDETLNYSSQPAHWRQLLEMSVYYIPVSNYDTSSLLLLFSHNKLFLFIGCAGKKSADLLASKELSLLLGESQERVYYLTQGQQQLK